MAEIQCSTCTFTNTFSNLKCSMCDSYLEKKDDMQNVGHMEPVDFFEYESNQYSDPFTVMTTNVVGEISSSFVEWFEKMFGIKISLSVTTTHSIQRITKRQNSSLDIMLKLKNKHFTFIYKGKEIDLGMYNTAPQNLPECVKSSYFDFLKKNKMDKKKCSDCCLPMCIIVVVLLFKNEQQLQDEKFAKNLVLADIQTLQDEKFAKDLALSDIQSSDPQELAFKKIKSKRDKKKLARKNKAIGKNEKFAKELQAKSDQEFHDARLAEEFKNLNVKDDVECEKEKENIVKYLIATLLEYSIDYEDILDIIEDFQKKCVNVYEDSRDNESAIKTIKCLSQEIVKKALFSKVS